MNLNKIIDEEIAITPEIMNTNIYKNRRLGAGLRSIMWIIVIIVLIIKMIKG